MIIVGRQPLEAIVFMMEAKKEVWRHVGIMQRRDE